MKKFTQLLSYSARLFLCLILISLTGCEKEDLDPTTTDSTISKDLRLRNFSSDIIKLSDKNFNPILRSQIQNSISYNDREIDTSIARVIRIGNYEAYTFTTIKEEGYDETQLENIIFSSNDTDGDYTATFVSFDLTEGQYINLLNNKDLEYPLSLTNYETQNLVFDDDDCVDVTVTITHTNEDGEYSFVPGQSVCQHPGECIVTTTIQVNYLAPSSCNDNGGGNVGSPSNTTYPVSVIPSYPIGGILDDSNTTYNPSSPGGNNNGNYDGLTDENGFPVIKGSLTLFSSSEKFIANLPSELATIFDGLPEGLQEEIEDFIDNHPDDETAEAFAEEAIKASEDKDGDGEPDAEVDFEESIVRVLPECLDEIVFDLILSNKGKFSKVIDKFVGHSPVPENYNWSIVTDNSNVTSNASALTSSSVLPGRFVETTILTNNTSSATDLSMARTFIHEAFHAYLVFVYRYHNIDKSYVNLINQYANQFNNNANDIHHAIFIQTNIVQEIAQGLEEFGNKQGYNLSSQYYQDMAWGGLTHIEQPSGSGNFTINPAFNQAVPNNADQQRILNRLDAEKNNQTVNNVQPEGSQACP